MFLTEEEIRELTGKTRRSSQAKVLNTLGIVHKIRPDGSLVVLRSHVEQQLGGRAPPAKKEKEYEPNWAFLDAENERARAQRERANQKRKEKGLPPLE